MVIAGQISGVIVILCILGLAILQTKKWNPRWLSGIFFALITAFCIGFLFFDYHPPYYHHVFRVALVYFCLRHLFSRRYVFSVKMINCAVAFAFFDAFIDTHFQHSFAYQIGVAIVAFVWSRIVRKLDKKKRNGQTGDLPVPKESYDTN